MTLVQGDTNVGKTSILTYIMALLSKGIYPPTMHNGRPETERQVEFMDDGMMKHKKISEMTATDKAEFLEQTKQAMVREYGVPWEFIEAKLIEEIENTFDDEKFPKMDPDFRIDAAYARKEFGDNKPELIDYMLWMLKFTTKSEYVDF